MELHLVKTPSAAGIFGSDPYSREEIVAEMGASFLCSNVQIDYVLNLFTGKPNLKNAKSIRVEFVRFTPAQPIFPCPPKALFA